MTRRVNNEIKEWNGQRHHALLEKIRMMCNTKAKRLHTDGAKEQDTKELRKFLDANGTKTSHTAPNASKSNTFAERRFRRLISAARTAMAVAPHMPKRFWTHAVLDAAEKGNHKATAKNSKLTLSPYRRIERLCPEEKVPNPATLLPWGTNRRYSSAVKFKTELENRAEEARYLRRLGANLY